MFGTTKSKSYSMVQITAVLFNKGSRSSYIDDLHFFDVRPEDVTKDVVPSAFDSSAQCNEDKPEFEFTEAAVGFEFSAITEGYEPRSGIGWEIEGLGVFDTFEPFKHELIGKAMDLFSHAPKKDTNDGIRSVNFIGLFSCEYSKDYEGECESEVDLCGFFSSNEVHLALFAK